MNQNEPQNQSPDKSHHTYIVGGTGHYGALTASHGRPDTLVKHETFADAKTYIVLLANEYLNILAEQHDLHTRLAPGGQHPSMNVEPPVKVHLTDDYLFSQVEIIVNVYFEDETRNKLLDRRFAAGWIKS